MWKELTAKEKITRTKIQLGQHKPFWAYLVMNLRFREVEEYDTIGINKSGLVVYSPKFVNSLSEAELEGVLIHEVFHLAFQHLDRLKEFKENKHDFKLWNISADIITNNHILSEGFVIPSQGIIPRNNSIKIGNVGIDNISSLMVEQVYNLLKKDDENDDEQQKGFDNHEHNENDDEQQTDNTQTTSNQKDWKEVLSEAVVYAKQRGDLSANTERLVGNLVNPEIDWRQKLYKFITKQIPYDFTYSLPSKKSIASGIYLPSSLKEKIDVVVGVDVSGSLSKKEYDKFITEIIGLTKSFASLRLRLLSWDTEINDDLLFENGNFKKIENLKLGGGGGTDVDCFFRKINDDYPNTKVVICLTDGYFNKPKESLDKHIIWVLTPNGTDASIDDGEVVKL